MNSDLGEFVISRRFAALAPLLFVAHVLEEAPGFVAWFNRVVEPDISRSSFLSVNSVALVITVVVAVALASPLQPVAVYPALAWFSFLFFANAVLHLVGSLVHGYSPGTVTATCLYVPFFLVFFRRVVRHTHTSAAALVSVVGALPMIAHGYLIVFKGSRLF